MATPGPSTAGPSTGGPTPDPSSGPKVADQVPFHVRKTLVQFDL